MFRYEYEKRGRRDGEWSREVPTTHEPAPAMCTRMHNQSATSLRVWAAAGVVCLVVCLMFVLATLFVSQWGRGPRYGTRYGMQAASSHTNAKYTKDMDEHSFEDNNSIDDGDNDMEILEKFAIFKNLIANRDNKKTDDKVSEEVKVNKNLVHKAQLFPEHDTSIVHTTKKIEKKDQAKILETEAIPPVNKPTNELPKFKFAPPEIYGKNIEKTLPTELEYKRPDYDYLNEYYEDNIYDDYMQSNSMTSYLIEKVQELHDWITKDSDFATVGNSTKKSTGNEFSAILKALNSSIIEGNVSIIMNKLRDLYHDENHSANNKSRKIILTNNTNLLSFGILTLDVMLLHNIQLMAWENQESLRTKMLKDPDVFAFNALFMDPKQVDPKRNEIHHPHENVILTKRQNTRHDISEESFAKNIFENVLELGMNTARAAINLGRAYKNTRAAINQISNRENKDISQNLKQLSRNADANAHALSHLQTFGKNDSGHGVANTPPGFYTELDCVWQLYCKNLVATTKLSPPYGVMARINGVALRMLSGELAVEKALDTLLYEAVSGWTDLKCSDMFPRCSKTSAASVVLESIVQPLKRSQANRTS